ncbi:MAG: hypothetical protein R3Y11_06260 [Pseudomonadota bacterium]
MQMINNICILLTKILSIVFFLALFLCSIILCVCSLQDGFTATLVQTFIAQVSLSTKQSIGIMVCVLLSVYFMYTIYCNYSDTLKDLQKEYDTYRIKSDKRILDVYETKSKVEYELEQHKRYKRQLDDQKYTLYQTEEECKKHIRHTAILEKTIEQLQETIHTIIKERDEAHKSLTSVSQKYKNQCSTTTNALSCLADSDIEHCIKILGRPFGQRRSARK